MDAPTPGREDDLSAVERRLAGWQPESGGLHTDALLFAAGHAAGRRGRGPLLWPALCAVLAVQAAGLGVWGLSERAGRLALAGRLPERPPDRGTPPPTAVAALPESPSAPSPDDYLHLRRRAEQDPNLWLASAQPAGPPAPGPPPPPVIFRAGQRDDLLEQ
jgi:hypothetical protein